MPGYNPSLMTSRDYIATPGLWYLSHLLCLLNYLSVVWKDWEASPVARPREIFINGSGVYLWSLTLKGRHWCVPLETVSMVLLAVTQALTSIIFREATDASFSPVHSNLFQRDIKKFTRFRGKISVWKCHLKLYFICALIFVLSAHTQQKTKFKWPQKPRFGYSMCKEFLLGQGGSKREEVRLPLKSFV